MEPQSRKASHQAGKEAPGRQKLTDRLSKASPRLGRASANLGRASVNLLNSVSPSAAGAIRMATS